MVVPMDNGVWEQHLEEGLEIDLQRGEGVPRLTLVFGFAALPEVL
jgi:hypothetical protein